MVPVHLSTTEKSGRRPRIMSAAIRTGLIVVAAALVTVFIVAALLNPYEADGTARTMGTHVQIGLPPCTFQVMTGVPCPSCGLTTSVALLAHGDVRNSLRANAAGTVLALFWLALIPWCLISALVRRYVMVVSLERALLVAVIFFVGLLLVRWAIVLSVGWYDGKYF
jgi:hypothetical protein